MNPDFKEMMKTDAGCTQLLMHLKYRNGKFKCKDCGSRAYVPLTNKKATIECAKCTVKVVLTKGTFFEGLRTPLSKIFRILTEYAEAKGKSAAALAREFEVSYSTVWRLLHKLRKLFEEISQPLIPGVVVHCSGLMHVLFKRSLESAADSKANQLLMRPANLGPPSRVEETAVGKAMGTIGEKVQGIARKYAQPYAAELCFLATSFNFMELLRFCFGARPVTNKEIEQYSSPDFLILPE
jgi:DNA-directed RNA polymerase subunit RPC12/RpoP